MAPEVSCQLWVCHTGLKGTCKSHCRADLRIGTVTLCDPDAPHDMNLQQQRAFSDGNPEMRHKEKLWRLQVWKEQGPPLLKELTGENERECNHLQEGRPAPGWQPVRKWGPQSCHHRNWIWRTTCLSSWVHFLPPVRTAALLTPWFQSYEALNGGHSWTQNDFWTIQRVK